MININREVTIRDMPLRCVDEVRCSWEYISFSGVIIKARFRFDDAKTNDASINISIGRNNRNKVLIGINVLDI
jgi:hypothetical protein